jgi:hypothetical protein
MSIGYFTDKAVQPSPGDIQNVIGTRFTLWEDMLKHIRDTYEPQEDFKFLYGKNYGWAMRFKLKSKLLTSLYPADGGFKVQIILSSEEIETALAMDPGKNVRQTIDEATPYPEGRWLFIPVENPADMQDVINLLELHSRSK